MSTTQHTPGLVFDGLGINGPDEYRTRIATFTRGQDSAQCMKYGAMFAASPELLASLQECEKELTRFIDHQHATSPIARYANGSTKVIALRDKARAAIAKATA